MTHSCGAVELSRTKPLCAHDIDPMRRTLRDEFALVLAAQFFAITKHNLSSSNDALDQATKEMWRVADSFARTR